MAAAFAIKKSFARCDGMSSHLIVWIGALDDPMSQSLLKCIKRLLSYKIVGTGVIDCPSRIMKFYLVNGYDVI